MQTLLKLILAATLAFSASFANAAFVNTSSGPGNGYGNYDETTSTGYLAVSSQGFTYSNTYTQIEDTFSTAGVFNFDWILGTHGHNPSRGGYLLNGTKVELGFNDNAFITPPSGTTSVTLAAGDTFGWFVESILSKEATASLNLSNASFTPSPSAVPVPAAAWLFGSALLGFAGLRRKQHA